jgi:hypothetical protein
MTRESLLAFAYGFSKGMAAIAPLQVGAYGLANDGTLTTLLLLSMAVHTLNIISLQFLWPHIVQKHEMTLR